MKVKSLSRVRLLATPWTAAYQAPPSMGFSRQEHWSGVPSPPKSQRGPFFNVSIFLVQVVDMLDWGLFFFFLFFFFYGVFNLCKISHLLLVHMSAPTLFLLGQCRDALCSRDIAGVGTEKAWPLHRPLQRLL